MVAFLTQTTVCGFSLYQTLAYFLIYSCLGWCLEVVYAAVTTGKLVNRGFLNGPVCPIYGFGMAALSGRCHPAQCPGAGGRLGPVQAVPHPLVGLQ